MSKEVDSGALTLLNRSMNLAGRGSAHTLLLDGVLNQVIEVGGSVRRSLALAGSEGIWLGQLQCEHGGAGSEAVAIDPYAVGGNGDPGFPVKLPNQFDLWLITAAVARDGGAGTGETILSVVFPAVARAFSRNNDGTSDARTDIVYPLARWDSIQGLAGLEPGVMEDGAVLANIGHRIRRGCKLQMNSNVGAAADIQINMVLGVFPATFGQDAAT